jgi:Ca2+-binding RTX toxin-like protein
MGQRAFVVLFLGALGGSAHGLADPENPACEYDPVAGVLTVLVDDNESTIETSGDRILATGGCPAEATLTSVDTIRVIGGSIDNTVVINGVFAPGRTPEADGMSEIEIVVSLKLGNDLLVMKPTLGDDVVTFSRRGLDVGGDLDEDVTVVGVESFRLTGWEGNDVIDASGYRGSSVLTLNGGGGDDVITGSPAGDFMYGNNQGGSGVEEDEIHGGGGDDYIDGGDGDDRLYGGAGNDTFYQGAGNAYDGSDLIRGGSGVDFVDYSDRTVTVTVTIGNGLYDDGGAGEADMIDAAVENATGGSGADILVGSLSANTLTGGSGDDELYGGGGDDLLRGGDGADLLVGDDGNDSLQGGAGNDSLDGGAGVDDFLGGTGDDTFINDDGVAETVNCGGGAADDPEPSAGDTFIGCELI